MIDASIVATALLDDDVDGDHVRDRLRGATGLAAPELVDLEVTSVIRRRRAASVVDARRAGFALEDLVALPIQRYPHRPLLGRVWELRENVTPYDAAYVALAELLDVVLLTADQKLANSPGLRCEVEVLSSS